MINGVTPAHLELRIQNLHMFSIFETSFMAGTFFATYYSNTALAHGPGIRYYVVLCTVIEGLLFPNVAHLPKLLAVVIKSNYSTETAYFDMVCYLKWEASSGPISFVVQQTDI